MSLASHDNALPALVSDVGNREIASCINTLGCISRRHIVQTAAIHWHKHVQAHAEFQMPL